MSDNDPHRFGERPSDRFEGAERQIDLNAVGRQIQAEHASVHGRRQATVFKHDAVTIAMFSFDADAGLPQHKAGGVAVIMCLSGIISVTTPSQTYKMSSNMMVVLDPGVPHAVLAHEPSQMLLTVSLLPQNTNG